MTDPAPGPSTPEGRFLIAYGAWEHARRRAGFATLSAPPAHALALFATLTHWTVELDQAWELMEGRAYTDARDAHPARGPLSAMRVITEQIGVLAAVESTLQGPLWRPADDLALGPVDRQVYAEHAAGRALLDPTDPVLDLFVYSQALDGGHGRTLLTQHPPMQWQDTEGAPQEPDTDIRAASARMTEEAWLREEATPEAVEAHYARSDGMFLTLVHGEQDGPGVSEELRAWRSILNDLLHQGRPPSMTTGGPGHSIYLFKGPYARETIQTLTHIVRALDPGGWEVVEGYHPPPVS